LSVQTEEATTEENQVLETKTLKAETEENILEADGQQAPAQAAAPGYQGNNNFPVYAQILVGVFGGILVLTILIIALVIIIVVIAGAIGRQAKLRTQSQPLYQSNDSGYNKLVDDHQKN